MRAAVRRGFSPRKPLLIHRLHLVLHNATWRSAPPSWRPVLSRGVRADRRPDVRQVEKRASHRVPIIVAEGAMRMATALFVSLAALVSASPAQAQRRGEGSGRSSTTLPATRNSSADEMPPATDMPVTPRHGFMGGLGTAPDPLGASRLGAHAEHAVRASYGESAQPGAAGAESYQAWKSGDRVRSHSSADVRAARQQQAPDLEWVR